MKIISRGTPNEEKPVRGTCRNCNSVIEAQKKEVRSQYDRNEYLASGECPVCNKQMWFYEIR